MAILVTGGAGYIGSHTVVELQSAGYDVVVVDNLSNSSEKSLERVEKITGKPVKFYKADILDREALNEIFEKEEIDSCIHFAGLKAVGESVAKPWEYYENNIAGTLTLVDVMRKHNVKNIIFSSSATILINPRSSFVMSDFPFALIINLPTLTAIPFSFASSSVIPTDAISGSVYTQPGTTFTSTDTSFPASCSTTWIPWALAAWASCAPKIRSPIAYTPGILVSNFSFTTTRPRFISGVASSAKSPSVFGQSSNRT